MINYLMTTAHTIDCDGHGTSLVIGIVEDSILPHDLLLEIFRSRCADGHGDSGTDDVRCFRTEEDLRRAIGTPDIEDSRLFAATYLLLSQEDIDRALWDYSPQAMYLIDSGWHVPGCDSGEYAGPRMDTSDLSVALRVATSRSAV